MRIIILNYLYFNSSNITIHYVTHNINIVYKNNELRHYCKYGGTHIHLS